MATANSGGSGWIASQCFYVVQMCWFAGPHTFEPVDYLRLFPSIESAQVLAYQSAHALAESTGQPVRTIALSLSYGFSVAGSLFWIRKVSVVLTNEPFAPMAHVVCLRTLATGDPGPTGCGGDVGHGGLVMGTQSKRRVQAQQVAEGEMCVFWGTESAVLAEQYCAKIPGDCSVRAIPIGPANESYWWLEWPNGGAPPYYVISPSAEMHESKRRVAEPQESKMIGWNNQYINSSNEGYSLSEQRPNKRLNS